VVFFKNGIGLLSGKLIHQTKRIGSGNQSNEWIGNLLKEFKFNY
jgi:hypothetical protein